MHTTTTTSGFLTGFGPLICEARMLISFLKAYTKLLIMHILKLIYYGHAIIIFHRAGHVIFFLWYPIRSKKEELSWLFSLMFLFTKECVIKNSQPKHMCGYSKELPQ